MAYQTYITDALVCGTKASNTSDQSFLLFTREAGMLFAAARSVREERSRQRFALQDFSHIRVSLIKGKSGWRVGSVETFGNYYQQATAQAGRVGIVAIFRHLRRFIHGEEPAPELFDYCLEALNHVVQMDSPQSFTSQVITARMMYLLGYLDQAVIAEVVLKTPLAEVQKIETRQIAQQLRRALEQAETVSHL